MTPIPLKNLIGAGGGGKSAAGSGGQNKEDPNTLLSISQVKFVHLLCEGEIEGLVNGMQSVYLNNTPLLASATALTTVSKTIHCRSYVGSTLITALDESVTALDGIVIGMKVTGGSLPAGAVVTGLKLDAPHGVYISPPATVAQDISFTYSSAPTGDGAKNFTDFSIHYRYGTQSQDAIPGFDTIESSVSGVNSSSPIENASPQVITVTDVDTDAVRVSIYTPAFQTQVVSDKGVHLTGSYVQYTISTKSNGGSWTVAVNDAFSGKASSPYVRSHRVQLNGTGPWQVRVTRVTPDATDSNVQDKIYVYSVFSLIDLKLNYPNSVVFAGQFDAKQFSSIPDVAYHLKLLKIKVPANYDPISRVYATSGAGTTNGVWDGTFKTAWSDNPAWVFYDLVTHPRYGLGSFIQESSTDKWELYTIAQYCDQLVPSGFNGGNPNDPAIYLSVENVAAFLSTYSGYAAIAAEAAVQNDTPINWLITTLTDDPTNPVHAALKALAATSIASGMEPRFTCNLFLQAREEAYRVLANLASVFRGIVFWNAGKIQFYQDSPRSPDVTFSQANVREGLFTYAGTSIKDRHTVALVAWNDPDDFSKRRIEYVEDTDAVREHGIIELEIAAFGCASRGQARRVGRWALYSEQNETEMVTFETSVDRGAGLYPGQVINVLDPVRAGERMSGRLVAGSTTGLTFDAPITMVTGQTYTAVLITNTGAVATRTLVNTNTTTATVTFTTPLLSANVPLVGSVWAVSATNLVPQTFRVMQVEEGAPSHFKVMAMAYNEGKYNWIEYDIPFDEPPISALPGNVGYVMPPTNLVVKEEYTLVAEGLERQISASWDHSPDPYLKDYTVSYRYENSNWVTAGNTDANTFSFPVRIRTRYIVRLCANNRLGRSSSYLYSYYDIDDVLLENGAITGLELFEQGNDTVWEGKDVHIVWRWNAPNSTNGQSSSALNDPLLRNFVVEVLDGRATPPTRLRLDETTEPSYIYSIEKNVTDTFRNPSRDLIFRVAARDMIGHMSKAGELRVTNPQPELGAFPPEFDPDLIRLSSKGGMLFVNYDAPADSDFKGMLIFAQIGTTLTLADVVATDGEPTTLALKPFAQGGYLLYAGSSTAISLPLSSLEDYSLVFAPYDEFGYDGINYYGPVISTIVLEVDLTPPEVPTGLKVTSESTIESDGSQKVVIRAKFNPNSESDLMNYGWSIRKITGTPNFDPTSGLLLSYSSLGQPFLPVYGGLPARTESAGFVQGSDGLVQLEWIVQPDAYYEVRLNASDTSSNTSPWTPLSTDSICFGAADIVPPAIPEWESSSVAYRFVHLKWTNPPDLDFLQNHLFENTVNDSSTATEIKVTGADNADIQYKLTGQLTSTTRYFWLKSEDNTGNMSGFSSPRIVVLPEIVTPGNLTLNSEVVTDVDGTQNVYLIAQWENLDLNTENHTFYWEMGLYPSYDKNAGTTQGTTLRLLVKGATHYSFRVRTEDTNAGFSDWALAHYTTIKDTDAPNTPVFTGASVGFRNIFLTWDSNTELDFSHYRLYQGSTASFASATMIREMLKTTSEIVAITGAVNQFTSDTTYFFLDAVDTSGNVSGVSAAMPASLTALPAPIVGSVTSVSVVDSDGANRVYLIIPWNATAIPEFSGYLLEVSTVAGLGNYRREVITVQGATSQRVEVEGGTVYFVRVRVRDSNNGYSAWSNEVSLTSAADTTVPTVPSAFSVTATVRSAFLTWTNGPEKDLARNLIFRNTLNSIPALPYATIAADTVFVDTNVSAGVTYYYWVKAQDRSGNTSAASTTSGGIVPGQVASADIDDFAVGLTQRYNATVALQNDNWNNNSPTSTAVSWNSHTLYYQGNAYSITANSTTNKYIYWDSAFPTQYQTSATNPALTSSQFIIATNIAGAHDLAWNAMANALIGSAYIEDLAVTNAKVLSLAVDKLTAGSITAQTITLAVGGSVNAVLKSSNFNGTVNASGVVTAPGTAGFFINSAGYLEANNARFRGDIVGGTISIGSNAFQVDATGQMWMGASTYASAPFKVSATGVMTATGASITGPVTARSLEVAQTIVLGDASNMANSILQSWDYVLNTSGWILRGDGYFETNEAKIRGDLVAGTITIGTGNNIFKVDATGNVWLGNATQANAGVQMDKDGYFQLGPDSAPKLTFTPGTGVLSVAGYIQVGNAASDVNSGVTTIAGGKITADTITASQLAATITTTKELVLDTLGTIRSNGVTNLTTGTGIWIKKTSTASEFRFGDPAGQRISWDGATLTLTGAINISGLSTLATVATSGAYTNLSGKPSQLSDINSTESTKLAGIQAGATVGADLASNVINKSLANLDSTANTKLAGIAAGATVGADMLTNVSNKSLANLDSTANTKLAGIAAGATVGATFGLNLGGGPFATPSGTGLFIDATHLGYYSGSTWDTFMSSSGDFFLGGTGGALTWSSGVLTIQGSSSFKGTVDIGTSGAHCIINSSSFSYGSTVPFSLAPDGSYGGTILTFGQFSVLNPSSTATNLYIGSSSGGGQIVGRNFSSVKFIADSDLGFVAGADSGGDLFFGASGPGGSFSGGVRSWSDGKFEAVSTSGSKFAQIIYGPNQGAVQTAYALTVIHRENATSKYGLFVGTNWAASENVVLNVANVDATTGSVSSLFKVDGVGRQYWGNQVLSGTSSGSLGYIVVNVNGTDRKIEYFAV